MAGNSELWTVGDLGSLLHRVVGNLVAEGAIAVVLVGSHARGGATALSDVDLYAIDVDAHEHVEVVDGRLVTVSWHAEGGVRETLRQPRSAGAAVPAWRDGRILHDPTGIAATLQREASAFDWTAIEREADEWVASELPGYAEEVLKLVAARRAGDSRFAAVERSVLALRLAWITSVRHRLLYETENRLWRMVDEAMGQSWTTAHARALSVGDGADADEAALTLFRLAAEDADELFSPRQRSVVELALRVSASGTS